MRSFNSATFSSGFGYVGPGPSRPESESDSDTRDRGTVRPASRLRSADSATVRYPKDSPRRAAGHRSRAGLVRSKATMTLMSWFWTSTASQSSDMPNDVQSVVKQSGCPVRMGSSSSGQSACPVSEESRRDHPMILLDPRNNMRAGGESQ